MSLSVDAYDISIDIYYPLGPSKPAQPSMVSVRWKHIFCSLAKNKYRVVHVIKRQQISHGIMPQCYYFKPRIYWVWLQAQRDEKKRSTRKIRMSSSEKTFRLKPFRKKTSSRNLESIKNKTVKAWKYGRHHKRLGFPVSKISLTAEHLEVFRFSPVSILPLMLHHKHINSFATVAVHVVWFIVIDNIAKENTTNIKK